MLFGHNTDVKVGETVYHVQTEDRGVETAMIDTAVYCQGRVLHRLTTNYQDLLPLDAERENSLRKCIDDQHRSVAEEIRSGALHLVPPPPSKPQKAAVKKAANSAARANASAPLAMELINAKTWLAGKHADLHVAVRNKQNGEALAGARVTARIDGAADAKEFSTETGADGHARLQFEMPHLDGAKPALVIEATQGGAKGHLKFQLKARPRVPAAQS